MENFNKHYEELLISSLFRIQERPGVYIGSPSFEKLLDVMTGYFIAVYDLTGYRIVFEQQFRQYLCQKYQKKSMNILYVNLSDLEKMMKKRLKPFSEN